MSGRIVTRLAPVVLAAAALAPLAGCTSARNLLGPRESLCFRVLPEARAAVGPHPSFAGVRYLSGGQLVADVERAQRHGIHVPGALAAMARRPACLVGYRGHFEPTDVRRGWAPLPGPYLYAVVVTNPKTDAVVGTVVFRRVPFRLADVFPF